MEEQKVDKLTPKKKSAQWKSEAKLRFLEELPRSHTVTAACDFAGISREAAYQWKEQDEAFSNAWDQAVERTHDRARAKIFERAFDGVEEQAISNGMPVYYYEPDMDEKDGEQKRDERGKLMWKRGNPVMIRKYSDSLAALYARANLPEYKDKQQIDLKLQMAEQDAKDKEELLAGLAVAIANENKEQPA